MKKEDFKLTFKKAEELQKDFTQVPNTLWTDKQLSSADKVVLGYLLSHMDGFKANKTFLANGLGMDRSYFGRIFQHLENLKVLNISENIVTFNLNQQTWTQSPSETIVQDNLDSESKLDYSPGNVGLLSKISETIVQDSVVQSPTNNTIDNKNGEKETEKEFHGNDSNCNNNLISKVCLESKISETIVQDKIKVFHKPIPIVEMSKEEIEKLSSELPF